ncbi:MAG: hypothetical protein FWC19_02885 [Treponema sp.]|nr:hypothetical protein [Treponema sp.]MCL2271735.1 hypothetical protein [Treponema sp.]
MKNNQKRIFIFAVFLFALASALHAQSRNQSFGVTINTDMPVVGKPWILTFLIDYPDPDDVSLTMPSLQQTGIKDGEITLDRILKLTRNDNENIQTIVEYRFNVLKSGRLYLEKFIIECPGGIVETNPLLLEIQPAAETPIIVIERPVVVRLVWEINIPQAGTAWQMEKGQRAVLSLRRLPSNSGSYGEIHPPPAFFLPEVPPGVIISLSEIPADGQFAANITFIPAETGVFSLAARTLQYENTEFQIPALRINIRESAGELSSENRHEAAVQEEETPAFSFPDTQEGADRLPRTLVFTLYIFVFFILFFSLIIFYSHLRKRTK